MLEIDPADKAYLIASRRETLDVIVEIQKLTGESAVTDHLIHLVGIQTLWLETCHGKMPAHNRKLVSDGLNAMRTLRQRMGLTKTVARA